MSMSVVKVGGSLFDLPDLGPRLAAWLAQQRRASERAHVLVPGGGAAADVVRVLDRCHGLGEERSHRLALQAMSLNAHFLANLLERAVVVADTEALRRSLDQDFLPVLDAAAFLAADMVLPHTWDATSDSVAARLAVLLGARELVLLKSTPPPAVADWEEAGRLGFVDSVFAAMVTPSLRVRGVDLRSWVRVDRPEGPC
jgi:aspartokinase-like uncharacterized kinase